MIGTLERLLENPNTEKVWQAVDFKPLTYKGLMEKTGLARSTLYDALQRLEEHGFVERSIARKEGIRKPYTIWNLTLDGKVIKKES